MLSFCHSDECETEKLPSLFLLEAEGVYIKTMTLFPGTAAVIEYVTWHILLHQTHSDHV